MTKKVDKKADKLGRPTKYEPDFDQLAENYSLLGATDVQMAEYFSVSEVTLNAWKKKHPSFLKSLKRGKDLADSKVAASLYNRALGYSHPDVDIKAVNGEIVETDIIKHYPPDTTSCIFWLKNRQSNHWKDKREIENTGEVPITKVQIEGLNGSTSNDKSD